jgi:hypothetical protein
MISPTMYIVHGIGPGSTPLIERIPVPAHRMISPMYTSVKRPTGIHRSHFCIYIYFLISRDKPEIRTKCVSFTNKKIPLKDYIVFCIESKKRCYTVLWRNFLLKKLVPVHLLTT